MKRTFSTLFALSASTLLGSAAAGFAADGATVAFLMPDQASTRYEQHDFPGFKAEMEKLCATCTVIYQNANADAAEQQQQFNSVLAQGAKVVVLDPVDSTAAASLVAQAQAQAKSGDLRGATASFVNSFGVLGSMRRRVVSENSKFRLADRQRAICEKAMPVAQAFFGKNPSDTAAIRGLMACLGYSKSTALFDETQRVFAQKFARLPRDTQQLQRQAMGALAGFERQLLNETDPAQRKKWADSTAFYREKIALFESAISQKYPVYEKLRQFDYPLNCPLGAVQSRLDTGLLVVDYFLTDSFLFTTAMRCDGLKSWKMPLPEGFSAACTAFHRSLADPDWAVDSAQNAYLANAHRLFEWLVQPALTVLPGATRLQFVADGPLLFLPFSALLTRPYPGGWTDSDLPVLCRRFAVSGAWSAVFPADFFQKKGSASLDFGGFGSDYRDPETWISMHPDPENHEKNSSGEPLLALAFRGGGLDSLPNADDEVDAVAAYFGSQQTWLNKDCTKSNFEENASRCGILHIALHGSAMHENGAKFGLLFSKNEQIRNNVLTAADVARLDLRAGLVVVSACESGLGELRKGEGVLSMGRAFALSGCPAAVLNLWRADDFSSKSIMVGFYAGLKKGLPKDIALQKAWLDYLQNASSLGARPGFWANFELMGDLSPIDGRDKNGLSKFRWAIGVLGFAMVIWLIYRKNQD